jgi:hypothetical protein
VQPMEMLGLCNGMCDSNDESSKLGPETGSKDGTPSAGKQQWCGTWSQHGVGPISNPTHNNG